MVAVLGKGLGRERGTGIGFFGTKMCLHDWSLLRLSFKELHDMNIQEYRNSQGLGYSGSYRLFILPNFPQYKVYPTLIMAKPSSGFLGPLQNGALGIVL